LSDEGLLEFVHAVSEVLLSDEGLLEFVQAAASAQGLGVKKPIKCKSSRGLSCCHLSKSCKSSDAQQMLPKCGKVHCMMHSQGINKIENYFYSKISFNMALMSCPIIITI